MTQDMDEEFSFFYNDNAFGPAGSSYPVSTTTLELYQGKLPNQLLHYWKEYGFCGYADGLFWTVNPTDYMSVLGAWLDGFEALTPDSYFVVARSAFGKLYLWGTKSGQSLKIDCPWGSVFPKDQTPQVNSGRADLLLQRFFGGQQKKNVDQQDYQDQPLFKRALDMLGPLKPDEMYGFEPALALGGKAKLENLRKVKIIPHLTILAQLGERKLMRDIVQDARGLGLIR